MKLMTIVRNISSNQTVTHVTLAPIFALWLVMLGATVVFVVLTS